MASMLLLGTSLMTAQAQSQVQSQDSLPPVISEALKRAAIPPGGTSFFAQEVGSSRGVNENRALLSINADAPMNPASTMKLVTTYSALELLGPAYTWKTIAASNAPLKGDVLDGDLVLKGGGDPKLVLENFWLMLRQLRARGVREIRGDVLLDKSLFEASDYDPNKFDGEATKPYNVGPDALMVNYKAIILSFVPDAEKRLVRVTTEPQLAGLALGTVKPLDGPCGDWKARLGADVASIERIKFSGGYPLSCGEKTWPLSVLNHTQYTAALFRQLWGDLDGTLRGTVREGTAPPDARTLVEWQSPSLAEVVRDINKYSNNVMAKQLYLDLSAEVLKLPANTERSQRVVKTFLANRGVSVPELVIENGSGLSRSERISAQGMGRLLLTAWASPVMPELMSSLPLVGYDGTMRRRLKSNDVAGQAHIKTGTLDGVRAVAGYVLAASGKRYVVVSFVNHANAEGAQSAQDAFLQWVFERG